MRIIFEIGVRISGDSDYLEFPFNDWLPVDFVVRFPSKLIRGSEFYRWEPKTLNKYRLHSASILQTFPILVSIRAIYTRKNKTRLT